MRRLSILTACLWASVLASVLASFWVGPLLAQGLTGDRPGPGDIAPLPEAEAVVATGYPHNVANCWNVGGLSAEAQRVRLTLAAELGPDGRPLVESLRLVGADPASAAATEQAYEAARRAMIRCAQIGAPGPANRTIEITFVPSGVPDR